MQSCFTKPPAAAIEQRYCLEFSQNKNNGGGRKERERGKVQLVKAESEEKREIKEEKIRAVGGSRSDRRYVTKRV
jgi:hypothetical protein